MKSSFGFPAPIRLCLLMFIFSGCYTNGGVGESLSAVPPQGGRASMAAAEYRRMVTYAASLDLEVSSLDSLDSEVKKIVSSKNGFLLEANKGNENYHAKIQVPADKLSEAVEELSKLGEVESKSMNAQDVTNSYSDLEAKIKNLSALRDRYRIILDKAKDMKDILAVEQELNRVQGELERAEAQFAGLKEQIRYSTLNLHAKVSTILGPLGYVVHGVSWVVTKLFVIR